MEKKVQVIADNAPALIEQAGLALYERDPLAQNFMVWLTRANRFAGGTLPEATITVPGAPGTLNFRDSVHEADQARFADALVQALAGDGTYKLDYRLRMQDGRYVWVTDSGRVESAVSGLKLCARGVLTFIEPYITRAEGAEFIAAHDVHTGRANRHTFEAQLDAVITAQTAGTLLVASIDNMTFLNEAIGPVAVNDVVRAAVQRLDRMVGSKNTIARIGGDSFGIWLEGHTAEQAEDVANSILQAFRGEHFETHECAVHVSVTLGGVLLPDHAVDGIEALTRAEQALKTTRAMGRGTYRLYEASEDRRSDRLSSLADVERMRKAMASQAVILAYQPIVSAMNGKIVYYEALLRMRQADGSVASAFRFIQAMENHGLAQEVDRHVLLLALAAMTEEPQLRLSVNVSAAVAGTSEFQQFLRDVLTDRQDIASRLMLEITETAAVKDLTQAAAFVNTVHELGGKVALDDYGEGYTSLQHLRHLAVDVVKIDGALIKGITDNAKNQVLVKAILSMAQHMGLETVAEFVETEKEAAWLQRHGAGLLQGYFLGQPSTDMPRAATEMEKTNALLASTGMLTLAV